MSPVGPGRSPARSPTSRRRSGARRSSDKVAATCRRPSRSPPQALELLGGRTVHVDPWLAEVAWAYPQLRWRPVPVFQTFQAYTTGLDDINARFLASPAGPEAILHQGVALDGRVPRWESPSYFLQIFCRYRPVLTGPGSAILERGSNRCGQPIEILRRRVSFGETVPVPRSPDSSDLVVARFEDIDEPLSQRIRAVLLKPEIVSVRVGGVGDARFVAGHAENLHVVRLPACLDYGGGLDTRPFTSLALQRNPMTGQPPRRQPGAYSIVFFRLSLDCQEAPKPLRPAAIQSRSPGGWDEAHRLKSPLARATSSRRAGGWGLQSLPRIALTDWVLGRPYPAIRSRSGE